MNFGDLGSCAQCIYLCTLSTTNVLIIKLIVVDILYFFVVIFSSETTTIPLARLSINHPKDFQYLQDAACLHVNSALWF